MNESPEQRYTRLQAEIQDAILRNYPNPEREGCLGDIVIADLARNPAKITTEAEADQHSSWYHIAHCSPCYATFLELRASERSRTIERRQVTRRMIVAGSVAASVAGVGWLTVRRVEKPVEIELDLDKNMAMRGEAENERGSQLKLPNGELQVSLKLRKGSAAGLYSIELRELDGKTVFSKAVQSKFEGGLGVLRFNAAIHVVPGNYTLAVRNDHREAWRYYPVVLVEH